MKTIHIERLVNNALPELVPTDTLELPMELASLIIAELGDHHFAYSNHGDVRHYWWARLDDGIAYRSITILTRQDGTAAIMYRQGCPYTVPMVLTLLSELMAIQAPLIVVYAAMKAL